MKEHNINKEHIRHNLHNKLVNKHSKGKFILDPYLNDNYDYDDFSYIPLYLTVFPKSYYNIY